MDVGVARCDGNFVLRENAFYGCLRCGARYPVDLSIDSRGCPACAGAAPSNLELMTGRPGDGTHAGSWRVAPSISSLWRYEDRLPVPASLAVSLNEGMTPLIAAPRMGERLGIENLLVKNEGTNPTWSHKDRFSTVAVSLARAKAHRVVATASSGNAGASLAAYAARAGIRCVVATFAGSSGPMMGQIRKYGATIVTFRNKADRWRFLSMGTDRLGWFVASPFRAPVVGSHPAGIAGYRTLSYEIFEQMGEQVPEWCALPVCYGDALIGLWTGFEELRRAGLIAHSPRLVAAEAHGSLSATLAGEGDRVIDMTPDEDSLAVSIGATRSTYQALFALRASRGHAVPVRNRGLIALQEEIARREGVFAELASATPFAAVATLKKQNVIADTDRVVVIVTASGLKDLDRSTPNLQPLHCYDSPEEAWEDMCTGSPATV